MADMMCDLTPERPSALKTGNWKLETGNWKLEAGNWKLEAGSWKLEAGIQSAPEALMPRSFLAILAAIIVGISAGRHPIVALTAIEAQRGAASASRTETPEQFFGFKIGTDGELARYPKIVEYLQHLAKTTSRVKFEELGKTTMGNPYVLTTISSPENLAKLPRLIEINRRLANPRGLSPTEATQLAQEGRAFYFIYGTIHSTEVGNTQSLIEIAHRLATDTSPEIKQILDNVVVLL